jgi:hypothetical protein
MTDTEMDIQVAVEPDGYERREFRRHDLESMRITVERWDGDTTRPRPLGVILDISAGGIRLRTRSRNIRPEQNIRIRLELPNSAGISPFISADHGHLEPTSQWVGWIHVTRVEQVDRDSFDIAGRLEDMSECSRGMFSLYLSTYPIAA